MKAGDYIKCPHCSEEVIYGAIKCKHCKTTMETEAPAVNEQGGPELITDGLTKQEADNAVSEVKVSVAPTTKENDIDYDTAYRAKNVNILESFAVVYICAALLAFIVFTIIAAEQSNWTFFGIGLGILFNSLIVYYLILVFCGIAKDLSFIKRREQ